MYYLYRRVLLTTVLMLGCTVAGAGLSGGFYEITGTVQESPQGADYLMVEGGRYRLDAATVVISVEGKELRGTALEPGSKVLLRGRGDRVDKVFLLPADTDLPLH